MDAIFHISVVPLLSFLVILAVVTVDLFRLLKSGDVAIMITITMRGRHKCAIKDLGFSRKVPSLAAFLPRLCYSCLPTPLTLVEPCREAPLHTSFLYLLFVETSNQWTQVVIADATKRRKPKPPLFVDCFVPHHCCPPLLLGCCCGPCHCCHCCAHHHPCCYHHCRHHRLHMPLASNKSSACASFVDGMGFVMLLPPSVVLSFMPCLPHLLHNRLPRPHTPADYHHHNWLIVVFYSHQLVLSKEGSKD